MYASLSRRLQPYKEKETWGEIGRSLAKALVYSAFVLAGLYFASIYGHSLALAFVLLAIAVFGRNELGDRVSTGLAIASVVLFADAVLGGALTKATYWVLHPDELKKKLKSMKISIADTDNNTYTGTLQDRSVTSIAKAIFPNIKA
jgi:hypothetical protein